MPTPQNLFAHIPNDELSTAKGGVTADIKLHQLDKLKDILSDVTSNQQQNQGQNNNNLTFAMVAALAMRNR